MATITSGQRKHADYLRLRGLAVAKVYMNRLARLRAKEVRRVLDICKEQDTQYWPGTISAKLAEDYLPKWWEGLFLEAGVPMADTTARALQRSKAAPRNSIWAEMLIDYAYRRSGLAIVSVTGTFKDTLLGIVADRLAAGLSGGIEKVTRDIARSFGELNLWQCRRIAQTEGMIAMADAADGAARSLDIGMTKVWMTSGLANTRESHLAVDGVEVDADEPFVLPGGMLMYPHDTSMGADGAEIINCACACDYRPKGYSGTSPSNEPSPEPEPSPVAEPPAKTPEQIREERIEEIMKEKPADLSEEEKRALAENDLVMEQALGVEKGEPMDYEKADKGNANPDFNWRNTETSWNCQTCTGTYLMRQRGFDVTAGHYVQGNDSAYLARGKRWTEKWLNADGSPAQLNSLGDWMEAHGYTNMTPKRYQAFFEEYTKTPGIYETGIKWSRGAHCTLVERTADGELRRIEVQTGTGYMNMNTLYNECRKSPARYFTAKIFFSTDGILRIDDKLFNPKFANILLGK